MPESISFARYAELMASISPVERRKLMAADEMARQPAKPLSKSQEAKAEKKLVKERPKRSYRSKVEKSNTGVRRIVSLPDGKKKIILKKYFFTIYGNDHKPHGIFWMTSKAPTRAEMTSYEEELKKKYPKAPEQKLIHPYRLPVRSIKSKKP